MKKLLFLASFVFETGKIEYKDNQLVMVTDRDVQRFMEKQKALNPDKGDRGPYEHHDAAYDVFRTWFEEVYPESTLKHIICNRPIQSGLFFPKIEAVIDNGFSGPHNCKDQIPPIVEGEDFTDTVAIDLTGEQKYWDFGWYDTTEKEWRFQSNDSPKIFEVDHAKWFKAPKPTKEK